MAVRPIYRLAALVVVYAVSAACLPIARAHDIPNERIDRSIQVSLSPRSIAIDYEVSLTELTLTQDLRRLIGSLPGADRQQWLDRYGQVTGPLNAKGLLVDAQGEPVTMAMRSFDLVVEDHPRYTFHLFGTIPDAGRLRVRDVNYVSSEGTSRLAIRGLAGVVITGDSLPTDVAQIEIRPTWILSDLEERRTKQVQVEYRARGTTAPGSARPDPAGAREIRPLAPGSMQPLPATATSLVGRGRLAELLDGTSTASWLLVVLVAVALGAAHAIQPGHGKTLVTAVALGPDIRFYQPALLGLTATLAHMGSVLVIAAVLWYTGATRVASVHEALTRLAGFAIGAAGLWRIGRQIGGYSEHDEEVIAGSAFKNRGLIGLGLAGGVVPCWDAVALLLLAAAVGKLAAGVELVLAFSVGMAIVLVAIGLVAWKLKAAALGVESQRRWRRPLAIACGGILAAMGFYLFFQ